MLGLGLRLRLEKKKVQHIGMHNIYKIMIAFINLYLFQGQLIFPGSYKNLKWELCTYKSIITNKMNCFEDMKEYKP